MTDNPQSSTMPSWLYKLFTGHQYPYVRRLAKFAKPRREGEERTDPTREEIDAKFWEVFSSLSGESITGGQNWDDRQFYRAW